MEKKLKSKDIFGSKFEQVVDPQLKENNSYNNNYYMAGDGDKWFEDLLYYYYNSSTHASILNNLHRRLQEGYEDDQTFYQISLDRILFGGLSLQLLWNSTHDTITKLKPMDFMKIRCGLQDEDGFSQTYYYSSDWCKWNNRKIEAFHCYDENPYTDDRQIYYWKRISKGQMVYPKPDYISGLKDIMRDCKLTDYYCNLVLNNFNSNKLISINSPYSEEQKQALQDGILNSMGPEGDLTMVLYSNDKEHEPTVLDINNNSADEKYKFTTERQDQLISKAHNLPVQLLGIIVPGKLGQATEIPVFEAIYKRDVVDVIKRELVSIYEPLKRMTYDYKMSQIIDVQQKPEVKQVQDNQTEQPVADVINNQAVKNNEMK